MSIRHIAIAIDAEGDGCSEACPLYRQAFNIWEPYCAVFGRLGSVPSVVGEDNTLRYLRAEGCFEAETQATGQETYCRVWHWTTDGIQAAESSTGRPPQPMTLRYEAPTTHGQAMWDAASILGGLGLSGYGLRAWPGR